jgi:ketosteroid isomerase-like protein
MTGTGPDIEANKATAWRWIEAMVRGDIETMTAMLTDDCRVFVAGSTTAGGWQTRDQFVTRMTRVGGGTGSLFSGPMQVDVGAVTAEDDRVCVEMELHVPVTGGGTYNNQFHWLIRVRDGMIAEAKEYQDTLHAFDVIPTVDRAPADRERESNLSSVTMTMTTG